MNPLAEKHCVACRKGVPPIKGADLVCLFEQLEPGWEVRQESRLEKTFLFPDFAQAAHFVQKLTDIAEKENHHPDLFLAWGKVQVILYTHAINGLTESDFIFAAKCDAAYS